MYFMRFNGVINHLYAQHHVFGPELKRPAVEKKRKSQNIRGHRGRNVGLAGAAASPVRILARTARRFARMSSGSRREERSNKSLVSSHIRPAFCSSQRFNPLQ